MASIGRIYEEAAIDLGAAPSSAVRRVLLPIPKHSRTDAMVVRALATLAKRLFGGR